MSEKILGGLLGALVAVGVVASSEAGPQKGNSRVTPVEVVDLLRLDERQLLAGARNALNSAELRISDTAFRGLALIAPRRIASGSDIPVVVVSQATTLQSWEVPEAGNRVLLAQDLATGEVHTGRTVIDRKAEEYPPAARAPRPAPTGLAAEAIATGATWYDARAVLSLPLHKTTYALAALEFDRASNVVAVEFQHGAPSPPLRPAAINPPPAAPAVYEATPNHPPTPPSGVAFKFDIAAAQAGDRVIYGAFTKTAAAADVLASPQSVEFQGHARPVAAIVQLALVVVGLNQPAPRIFNLGIPVFGSRAASIGSALRGHFTVGLQQSIGRLTQGQYVGYVLLAGTLYGPVHFSVS